MKAHDITVAGDHTRRFSVAEPQLTTTKHPITGKLLLERLDAAGLLPPLTKSIRIRADVDGVAYCQVDHYLPEEAVTVIETQLAEDVGVIVKPEPELDNGPPLLTCPNCEGSIWRPDLRGTKCPECGTEPEPVAEICDDPAEEEASD